MSGTNSSCTSIKVGGNINIKCNTLNFVINCSNGTNAGIPQGSGNAVPCSDFPGKFPFATRTFRSFSDGTCRNLIKIKDEGEFKWTGCKIGDTCFYCPDGSIPCNKNESTCPTSCIEV